MEKDVTRIRVGDFAVGIVGLKQLLESMAEEYAGESDEKIRNHMLEQLERKNYVPAKSREDYGRAFLREFRKYLGQPYTEDVPQGLDVKVLGAGCAQCHHLTQLVMEVLTELDMAAGVDHVTDFQEIATYGVMGSPALLINGKVMAVGSVPPKERIKKWLVEAHAPLGN